VSLKEFEALGFATAGSDEFRVPLHVLNRHARFAEPGNDGQPVHVRITELAPSFAVSGYWTDEANALVPAQRVLG